MWKKSRFFSPRHSHSRMPGGKWWEVGLNWTDDNGLSCKCVAGVFRKWIEIPREMLLLGCIKYDVGRPGSFPTVCVCVSEYVSECNVLKVPELWRPVNLMWNEMKSHHRRLNMHTIMCLSRMENSTFLGVTEMTRITRSYNDVLQHPMHITCLSHPHIPPTMRITILMTWPDEPTSLRGLSITHA